jgi:hypothetical protein
MDTIGGKFGGHIYKEFYFKTLIRRTSTKYRNVGMRGSVVVHVHTGTFRKYLHKHVDR